MTERRLHLGKGGIAAERARTRILISDNIEMPLLKFVVAEAEGAMPALLGMAPERGTITINGTQVSEDAAKGVPRRCASWQRSNVTTAVGAPKSYG
jgi:hypothetical protein